MITQILSRHTGKSIETITAETERDRYLTADEALAYGLIDEVLHEHVEEDKEKKSEEKK